jgi:hypothetical protein
MQGWLRTTSERYKAVKHDRAYMMKTIKERLENLFVGLDGGMLGGIPAVM